MSFWLSVHYMAGICKYLWLESEIAVLFHSNKTFEH